MGELKQKTLTRMNGDLFPWDLDVGERQTWGRLV